MLVVVSAHIIPNPNIDDQEVKFRESDLTHMDEVIFIENISQTSEESNISELEEFALQVSQGVGIQTITDSNGDQFI